MDDLILYHGSRNLFTAFDYSKVRTQPGGGSSRLGIGMYWTTKKEKALNAYANMSEPLSENISFRGEPQTCSILYGFILSKEEQKNVLDLLCVTDETLKHLEETTTNKKTKNEIQKMLSREKRYPDFAIWARYNQDLIKKAGFNCLKEKNVFCFLEPEKLKWSILEGRILSGTSIPRSLITKETKIIIQNKLISNQTSPFSVQSRLFSGADLLSQTKDEEIVVRISESSLKSRLQQMTSYLFNRKNATSIHQSASPKKHER
jgi:hypothetical protein